MIRAEEKRPGRICFLCRPAKGPADPAGGELEAARTGLEEMGIDCRIIRTGSPGQAAAAVSAALERIRTVVSTQPGAEPFALIPALMAAAEIGE